ncbi:D-alanyl-D-alanine carboxypeptidase [Paenibacillus sp. J5C_2022]|nr:D-alanyl-D-alanine carboxypeptidase family protein [Paenibacillus sp. J5C2022]MCU6710056.1 D-alanyl-D-alanine carboxypeptidase [Paenibacillus sp. J5C2022]
MTPVVSAVPDEIETNAKAAALIDVASGRLLYSYNGDEELRIASLTKIMTAIVAIEHGDVRDTVKVSKRAVGKEGSSIYLQLDEEMSLSNMLFGLMLRSGNDAATAIAEHVGGTEEGFVHLMNEKAAFLGLAHTQFRNPHGLDADGHYSSANDLAKLTAYALHNDVFAEIVATKQKKAPNPNDSWDYSWRNKNKMLTMYDGADGVKTGYTKKSFRCLVSSATRNGQQLAAVTINDGDDWADHRDLLDWGFQHYPLQQIASKGESVDGTTIVLGQSFRYPLEDDEQSVLTRQISWTDQASEAYALGDRGIMSWRLNGERIGAVPLYESGSAKLKTRAHVKRSEQSLKQFRKASKYGDSIKDKWKRAIGASR